MRPGDNLVYYVSKAQRSAGRPGWRAIYEDHEIIWQSKPGEDYPCGSRSRPRDARRGVIGSPPRRSAGLVMSEVAGGAWKLAFQGTSI